jgi:hypothetical protein
MDGSNEPRFVVDTKESKLGGRRLTNMKGVDYIKMDLQNNVDSRWNFQKIKGKAYYVKV